MISRGLSVFSKKVPRKYLPSRVRALLPRTEVNEKDKMHKLGAIVGLTPSEVQSIIDPTTGQTIRTGSWADGRLLLIVSFIMVLVVIMFVIFAPNLDWGGLFGNTTPVPTYTPGTLYSTIKPKDFD